MSLFNFTNFLAAADAPAPGGGMTQTMLILLMMFAGMYFLVIAPQRKKQKEHEKRISSLKSGDRIITNGGLYGTIVSAKSDRFVVKLGDNVKIELAKNFVATVVADDDGKAEVNELKDEKKK